MSYEMRILSGKNYARCVNLLSVRFTVRSPLHCNCNANSSAYLAEPGG